MGYNYNPLLLPFFHSLLTKGKYSRARAGRCLAKLAIELPPQPRLPVTALGSFGFTCANFRSQRTMLDG